MMAVLALIPILAATSAIYVPAYWISLILGGGLLVLSLISGHGHHDFDSDTGGLDFHPHGDTDANADADAPDLGHIGVIHADVAHAHAGSASQLSTWLSIRFAVFFLAMFGAVGVILTHMTDLTPRLTLTLAVAGGALVGQGVHHLFRLIRRTSGNSTPQPIDYVNKLARVTIGISPPDPGEVVLQVRGGERYVPAVAGCAFAIGDEVVVAGYRAGVAEVVSRAQYEQQRAR
jgi:hypothetical protein